MWITNVAKPVCYSMFILLESMEQYMFLHVHFCIQEKYLKPFWEFDLVFQNILYFLLYILNLNPHVEILELRICTDHAHPEQRMCNILEDYHEPKISWQMFTAHFPKQRFL